MKCLSRVFMLSLGPIVLYTLGANWESQHIFRPRFPGTATTPRFLRDWDRTTSSYGRTSLVGAVRCVASFQNLNHLKSKLGQISTYLTPCRGGMGEILSVIRKVSHRCSSETFKISYKLLRFEAAIRQKRLMSKIGAKFRTFDPM